MSARQAEAGDGGRTPFNRLAALAIRDLFPYGLFVDSAIIVLGGKEPLGLGICGAEAIEVSSHERGQNDGVRFFRLRDLFGQHQLVTDDPIPARLR